MPTGIPEPSLGAWGWIARHRGLVLPLMLVTLVVVLVVPVPAVLLDVFLSVSITLSMLVLLTTVYVRRPLDFSVFPSVLLTLTLLRLVLNVASTRLILLHGGTDGTASAGEVIRAFGEFVAGDNIIVGLVIFFIMVVAQFVVITKGATRISEVAARFALDGLPGKQMAIDADLNAGLIDFKQGRNRRHEIHMQTDFYSAMDGASKFVRGDALAGILIVFVNIAGGLYMGIAESGMTLTEATSLFTKLTIGDGLVTQVPALLTSIAAALIMTRSGRKTDLPSQFVGQLIAHPGALAISALFLGLLSLTQLPTIPLLLLSILCITTAYVMHTHQKPGPTEKTDTVSSGLSAPLNEDPIDRDLHVEVLELEIGFGLIRLSDQQQGSNLIERISQVRKAIVRELGILIPKVKIRDNLKLKPREYLFKVRDVAVANGTLYPDRLMARSHESSTVGLEGLEVQDPVTQRSVVWIESFQKQRAENLGYTIYEPLQVLQQHLHSVVRQHAESLLTRQQVRELLDRVKTVSPAVIEEVVPHLLQVAEVQDILSNLLRENVSIRNLETIMETLGSCALRTKDTRALTEQVRRVLAPSLSQQYRDDNKVLHAMVLHPALESQLRKMTQEMGEQTYHDLPEGLQPLIIDQVEKPHSLFSSADRIPVLVCHPELRLHLKSWTTTRFPNLVVLSTDELTPDTVTHFVACIETNESRSSKQHNQRDKHLTPTYQFSTH